MRGIVPETLVTRSRRCDRALFLSILLVMLLLAPRLRVYYRVTVVEIVVEQVTSDGGRLRLPTPQRFAHPGDGDWPGESLVGRVTPRIRDFMARSEWARRAAPGTRFEWTVRWGDDAIHLDHVDRIIWEVPADPLR